MIKLLAPLHGLHGSCRPLIEALSWISTSWWSEIAGAHGPSTVLYQLTLLGSGHDLPGTNWPRNGSVPFAGRPATLPGFLSFKYVFFRFHPCLRWSSPMIQICWSILSDTCGSYPLVNYHSCYVRHSYWTWLFIVDLPWFTHCFNGGSFHRFL